jgi:hypothetical protein
MVDWLQFALIIFFTTIEDLGQEIVQTYNAARDLVRYRLRWIVREKLQSMLSRKR